MNLYTVPLTYLRGTPFASPKGSENDYTNLPRPLHSVAYIVSGKATFFYENERIEVTAGDVIYVAKGCRYHSVWEGEPETNVLSCHFDLVPFGEPIGNRFYPLQRISNCEALHGDFVKVVEETHDTLSSLEAIGSFFHILSDLFSRMTYAPRASINEAILSAVRYIEAHYDTPLKIPSLARLCHLSPSYFYECFKRETGKTPIEYKNRIAIAHAERILLDHPDVSIEEISEKLGFESPIYFRRLFKAQTQKTPREYRNTAQREF